MRILEKLNPHLTTDDLWELDFLLEILKDCPDVPAEWT